MRRLVVIVDVPTDDEDDEVFETVRASLESVLTPLIQKELGSETKVEVVGEHDYDEDLLGPIFN